MPPDGGHSELDDALFSGAASQGPLDATATPPASERPPPPDEDLSTLDTALFGELPPDVGDDITDGDLDRELFMPAAAATASAAVERTEAFEPTVSEPAVFEPGATEPAVPEPEIVWNTAPPVVEEGAPALVGRPSGRRAEREAAGQGALRRFAAAAAVALVVLGLGGLAYATLGSDDGDAPTNPNQVEVRGAEVTRTTLRSTTTSSSTTTPTTAAPTTTAPVPVTTAAPVVVPEPAPEPEPELPPATDPPVYVPPPTDPPPTTPTLPPTTAPPTTEPPTTAP